MRTLRIVPLPSVSVERPLGPQGSRSVLPSRARLVTFHDELGAGRDRGWASWTKCGSLRTFDFANEPLSMLCLVSRGGPTLRRSIFAAGEPPSASRTGQTCPRSSGTRAQQTGGGKSMMDADAWRKKSSAPGSRSGSVELWDRSWRSSASLSRSLSFVISSSKSLTSSPSRRAEKERIFPRMNRPEKEWSGGGSHARVSPLPCAFHPTPPCTSLLLPPLLLLSLISAPAVYSRISLPFPPSLANSLSTVASFAKPMLTLPNPTHILLLSAQPFSLEPQAIPSLQL